MSGSESPDFSFSTNETTSFSVCNLSVIGIERLLTEYGSLLTISL